MKLKHTIPPAASHPSNLPSTSKAKHCTMMVLAKLSATRVILAPALFFLCVVGQTSHTVTTGLQGSFFDPATLSVQLNDTVIFVFSGAVHTVTQSTFENPCVALPGGFNSGGAGTNNTAIPPPTWTLQITNVSAPIWYFCQVTRPQSHCAAGMVGVINTPSISMFQQFQAAAKAVSGTPAPVFTVALQGSGAFATAAPSTPPFTSPPASSVTVTVSASTTSSTTPTPTSKSSSSKNVGVIVGGAVGGVMGGIILIVLLAICWRTYSNGNRTPVRREPSPMVTQELGYQYRERPYTTMTADDPGTLSPSKSLNTVHRLESDGNMSAIASTSSPLMPMRQFDSRNSNPLVPVRRPVAGRSGTLAMQGHVQQNGSLSAIETPRNVDSSDVASTSSRSDRGAAAGIDIQSLAQEVAAVLRSTSANASPPPNTKEGQSRLIITNDDDSQVRLASTSGHRDNERDNMTTESPPPHYTIAGGGQRNW